MQIKKVQFKDSLGNVIASGQFLPISVYKGTEIPSHQDIKIVFNQNSVLDSVKVSIASSPNGSGILPEDLVLFKRAQTHAIVDDLSSASSVFPVESTSERTASGLTTKKGNISYTPTLVGGTALVQYFVEINLDTVVNPTGITIVRS